MDTVFRGIMKDTMPVKLHVKYIYVSGILVLRNKSQPVSHTCSKSGPWKPFSEAIDALRLKRLSSVTMIGVFSTRTNESDRGVVATPSGGRYSPMANDRHID